MPREPSRESREAEPDEPDDVADEPVDVARVPVGAARVPVHAAHVPVDVAHVPVDVVARHGKLLGRTALVSFLTLASRIVGFLRESLAASMFGDRSPINDAFVTAWRVPNMFRALLGEGAISTSLQTALTKADAERGAEAGRHLFLAVARTVAWILIAVCAVTMLAVWLLPDTLPFTDVRWLGAEPGPVRELCVRMLPFVIFVCLSAVASGALYVRGHFLAPSIAPVVMNCWWILALLIVAREFGWSRPPDASDAQEMTRQMEMMRRLAGFVLVAGALLVLVQVPALVRSGLLFGPRDMERGGRLQGEVWAILRASAPLAIGAAVYQINAMISGFMAVAMLEEGGPTALYYATRLQQLPLSLVSIAATSAVFPAFTALGHVKANAQLKKLHDETHLAIAFVAIPATLGLFVLARPVCAVCFEHGAFGPEGVERTAAALRWLTVAILPAGAVGLVARAYYALGDVKTPVKIAIATVCVNTLLNVVLVGGLGLDADGLALATAITTWANLFLLLPGLRSRFAIEQDPARSSDPSRALARLAKMLAAGSLAAGVAWGTYRILAPDGDSATRLAVAIGASIATYAVAAHVMRLAEWNHLIGRLRGGDPPDRGSFEGR
jgi:putative peptidoglycan lipid II flippase